jgi:hypothetical protein
MYINLENFLKFWSNFTPVLDTHQVLWSTETVLRERERVLGDKTNISVFICKICDLAKFSYKLYMKLIFKKHFCIFGYGL